MGDRGFPGDGKFRISVEASGLWEKRWASLRADDSECKST